MRKLLDYLYINFYWLFQGISKTDTTNIGKPIILISIIIMTNAMAICMATNSFKTVFFNMFFVIAFCLLLIAGHYFLFIWKKRYIQIEKEFEHLTKKQKLQGRLFVILLWIEGFAIIPVYALLQ